MTHTYHMFIDRGTRDRLQYHADMLGITVDALVSDIVERGSRTGPERPVRPQLKLVKGGRNDR